MSIYRPGQKSGKTQYTNRVWFRISKSSSFRQTDFFTTYFPADACRSPASSAGVVGQGSN